jgi:drug/metabolite transporter (DMT)-like permease
MKAMETAETRASTSVAGKSELILLLTLSTLWGGSYTFIKLGVATITPISLIAGRTLIAGILLLCALRWRGVAMTRSPAMWRRFLVQALLNSVVPFTLIAWAEQSVDAGLATILNSATPILTVLGTWAITRHEAISPAKLFGAVLGMAGICLIIGLNTLDGLGRQALPQLAIVAATVCYAGAAIFGRNFKGLDPIEPAAGSMICGAIILLPLSLLLEHPWTLRPSASSLSALLGLSVLSTALAFIIYFRLVGTLGSIATSTQAYLRVPIGVAISIAFLHEKLMASAWIGLICVVIGVAAMNVRKDVFGRALPR